MGESEKHDYSLESIIKLVKEEEYGVHISLLDKGTNQDTGKPQMSIVVESNMGYESVQQLLWGLLEQYEEAGLD